MDAGAWVLVAGAGVVVAIVVGQIQAQLAERGRDERAAAPRRENVARRARARATRVANAAGSERRIEIERLVGAALAWMENGRRDEAAAVARVADELLGEAFGEGDVWSEVQTAGRDWTVADDERADAGRWWLAVGQRDVQHLADGEWEEGTTLHEAVATLDSAARRSGDRCVIVYDGFFRALVRTSRATAENLRSRGLCAGQRRKS